MLKSVEKGQTKKGRGKVRFEDDEDKEAAEYLAMKRALNNDIATSVADYTKQDWEYGEYNFPEDGYDYAKHLKEVTASPLYARKSLLLLQTGGGYWLSAPEDKKSGGGQNGAMQFYDEMVEADPRGNANSAVRHCDTDPSPQLTVVNEK